MSTNIFNIGKVNAINNNDITINTSSANVAEVVRAFMNGNAEDIQAEEVKTGETTCAKNAQVTYCEYIHRENLREQGLYSLDEFENMIAKAVKQPSTQFAEFLKKYKKQGNLDFHGQNKIQIFEYFRAHYPQMRAYKYNTFAAAF